MAIEKGSTKAMSNLGYYYEEQKDYDNMMKYYLMAIENNNLIAMDNLSYYYEKKEDYENMMKYYIMAIEHGDTELLQYNKNILADPNKRIKYINYIEKRSISETKIYNDTCPICLDNPIENNKVVLYCGHTYCNHCLKNIIVNEIYYCSICKQIIA